MLEYEKDSPWPFVARKILNEAKYILDRIANLKKMPKKDQGSDWELLLCRLRNDPNFGHHGLKLRFVALNRPDNITGPASFQGDDVQEDRAVYDEIKKLSYS